MSITRERKTAHQPSRIANTVSTKPNAHKAVKPRTKIPRSAGAGALVPSRERRVLSQAKSASTPALAPKVGAQGASVGATLATYGATFVGAFLITYGIVALAGSVGIEGARQQEAVARTRANEAIRYTALVSNDVDAQTRDGAIDQWASANRMVGGMATPLPVDAPVTGRHFMTPRTSGGIVARR